MVWRDAVAAIAAARLPEGAVVTVGRGAEQQFAQEYVTPELRRYEQRLAADPSQSGLDGQLLFAERRRVDEGSSGQSRMAGC